MAKSGKIIQYFDFNSNGRDSSITASNNSSTSELYGEFVWTAQQSILDNNSIIHWSFWITPHNINSITSAYAGNDNFIEPVQIMRVKGITVTFKNNVVYENTSTVYDIKEGQETCVASGDVNVSHDSEGLLSISLSCAAKIKNFYGANSQGQAVGTGCLYEEWPVPKMVANLNGTITLDNIPRHAVIYSAPNFNDEEDPTITYAAPKDIASVQACISFTGENDDIPYRDISKTGTSYTFAFTDEERATLWSILSQGIDNTGVRFQIKTVTAGGTEFIEYLTRQLTIINYKPTLLPEIEDTNSRTIELTGNKYRLVRYESDIRYSIGAAAHKGAEIATQSITNGNITKYEPVGTIEDVPSGTFVFSVMDSFGRTTRETTQYSAAAGNFVEYVRLTCSVVEVSDMTANGEVRITLAGKYFDGSFGTKNNSLHMHYDLVQNGGDPVHYDKGYINPTVNGSDYEYTFTISGLNYMSVYDITIRVSDEISVEPIETKTIVASTPVFDWSNKDFNFNVPVTIQEWQVDTVVEESTNEAGSYYDSEGLTQIGGYDWSFRKWSSGLLECWCSVNVTTDVSGAFGGLYTSGKLDKTNLIFPRPFIGKPVVVTSLAPNDVGGILMAAGSGSTTINNQATGPFEIVRGSSYSGATYTINYMIKGRWK